VNYQMTGNGPYVVAPSAINQDDGTGTNSLGEAPFTGQIFSNPGAGTLGELQRRLFSGPWSFDLDLSLQRRFRITERQSLELRMEGVNVLNHPSFYAGDQNINSNTFGVITSTFNPPRVMQFAASYRF
jgi:trimeric autotransporter adhesin